MKLMFISDLHGSAYYAKKIKEIFERECPDKIVSVGTISSGMTDFLRQDMAENPYNYMNKVVEIQAMSVDKTEHTIRHGRLMRIRDDKTDVECTLESVFS